MKPHHSFIALAFAYEYLHTPSHPLTITSPFSPFLPLSALHNNKSHPAKRITKIQPHNPPQSPKNAPRLNRAHHPIQTKTNQRQKQNPSNDFLSRALFLPSSLQPSIHPPVLPSNKRRKKEKRKKKKGRKEKQEEARPNAAALNVKVKVS